MYGQNTTWIPKAKGGGGGEQVNLVLNETKIKLTMTAVNVHLYYLPINY